MTGAANWRDAKAKAREADPCWDTAERVERRAGYRSQILASVSGAQLAELRQQLGLAQTQLAEAAGLSQSRISPIENGEAVSLDVLRAYIVGPRRPARHRREDRQHPPQRGLIQSSLSLNC